jgi:hypothetical protein
MARASKTDLIGIIAIIIGGLLVLGGLMLWLVTSLMSGLPRVFLIPAVLQIALGLSAAIGGFFLRRGHTAAKLLLIVVAIGVLVNLVLLASIFFTLWR